MTADTVRTIGWATIVAVELAIAAARPCGAQTVARGVAGSYFIYGTGVGLEGGQPVLDEAKYGPVYGTYSVEGGLSGPTSQESGAFVPDSTGSRVFGHFSGAVSLTGRDGRSLGLQVLAEGNLGAFPTMAEATLTHNDQLSLVWGGLGTTPAFPGTDLRFKYGLAGGLAASIDNQPGDRDDVAARASATVRFGAQSHSFWLTVNQKLGTTFEHLQPAIDFTASINQFGKTDIEVTFNASAFATWGRAAARLGHTLTLERIEFLDGRTPEELGWNIAFDSGMPSPNIHVPEPSTGALGGGAFLCAIGALLVKRRRAPQSVV